MSCAPPYRYIATIAGTGRDAATDDEPAAVAGADGQADRARAAALCHRRRVCSLHGERSIRSRVLRRSTSHPGFLYVSLLRYLRARNFDVQQVRISRTGQNQGGRFNRLGQRVCLPFWLQAAKLWNLALEIRRSTPAVEAGCSHCAKTVKSHCLVIPEVQPPRALNGSDSV